MTCAREKADKKLRLIASIFIFLETNDDMRLGKTEKILVHRSVFVWETNDDMCPGKTEEI